MSKIVLDSLALYKLSSETINISDNITLTPKNSNTLTVSFPFKSPLYSGQNHGSNVIVNTETDIPEVYMAYTISGATLSVTSGTNVVQYTPDSGGDATDLPVSSVFKELNTLFTHDSTPSSSLSSPPTSLQTHYVLHGDSNNDNFIALHTGTDTTVFFMMNIDIFEINASQLWLHESNKLDTTNVNNNVQVINSERSTNNNTNQSTNLPEFEWKIGENGLNGSPGDTEYDIILGKEFTVEFKDLKSTTTLNDNSASGLQINTSKSVDNDLLVYVNQTKLPDYLQIKPNNGNLGDYYSITSEIDQIVKDYKGMRERLSGVLTHNGMSIKITSVLNGGIDLFTVSEGQSPIDNTLSVSDITSKGAIFNLDAGVPTSVNNPGNGYNPNDTITVNGMEVTINTVISGMVDTFEVVGVPTNVLNQGDSVTLGDKNNAVTFTLSEEGDDQGKPVSVLNRGKHFTTHDNTQIEQILDISLSNSLGFDIDRARLRIMDQFDEEILSSNLSTLHQSIESKLATSTVNNSTVTSGEGDSAISGDDVKQTLEKLQLYTDGIRTHPGEADRSDTDSIQSLFRALQLFGIEPALITSINDTVSTNLSTGPIGTSLTSLKNEITKYKKQLAVLSSLAKSQRHMSKRVGDENAKQFEKLIKDVNVFLRSTVHQFEGDIIRKQHVIQQIVHDITRLQRKLNFSASQYKDSSANINNFFQHLIDNTAGNPNPNP